jgi:hypothetical protein
VFGALRYFAAQRRAFMADVKKKVWRKPEVRVLDAGSAETTSKGTHSDGGTKSGNNNLS